jgi:type VI secretion system protein ImpL
VQTFAMIVLPSESEINKTWQAQVVGPFQKTLAEKYPFSPGSKMEATSAEIGQVFGPEGVVAKFINTSMGPLVINRGSMLTARTWADIGITLAPQAVSGFPGWVAPLSSNGVAQANGAPQTVFQLQAHPAPGTTEYTVDIDGQQLRYRNTPPVWTNMVYPGPGTAGARISAVTFDGRTVELFNEAGQFGMRKMIEASTQTKKSGGVNELRWVSGNLAIVVDLRLVSNAAAASGGKGFQGLRLPHTIVGRAVAEPAIASIAAGGQ